MKKQAKQEVQQSEDRMLYKAGGKHEIHGGKFDFIVVNESEVEAKVKEGWFLTTTEAAEAAKKAAPKQQPAQQPKAAATQPAGATVGNPGASGAWGQG